MENKPHLGIDDLGVRELGDLVPKNWFVHLHCPEHQSNGRWSVVSLDCYSPKERLLCDGCQRPFGKKVLSHLKDRKPIKELFTSLENMQKFAAENETRAYHAHEGFRPPEDELAHL